jgi:N6-L-threonylcarbamoyladenine synthase
MNILSIETSCDETALSVITVNEQGDNFKVLSNLVISQIALHEQYGGVFPALAKREHAENLVPLCIEALKESSLLETGITEISDTSYLESVLEREPVLLEKITSFFQSYKKPTIDFIMVTYGPGLTPALWVGINFARALSVAWNIPILPVNHMEGHLTSILVKEDFQNQEQALYPLDSFTFPMISLLISGGHTQLILIKEWGQYEILGETLDDAVGEAFDKVARMLGMTYPGGPKISVSAKNGVADERIKLPRPMIHSHDYRFSFSGLKTAVRYLIENLGGLEKLDEQTIANISRDFEHSVTEVLLEKTKQAMIEYGAHGLIIAGGVAANSYIRSEFKKMIDHEFSHAKIFFPEKNLCGDNSLMIASAGFVQFLQKKETAFISESEIKAVGNLKL